jgi:hypothetical protein
VEWVLLGKILSPTTLNANTLNANTIRSAMTPAWGNPFGLKVRSIRKKSDNLFIVESGSKADMERV